MVGCIYRSTNILEKFALALCTVVHCTVNSVGPTGNVDAVYFVRK